MVLRRRALRTNLRATGENPNIVRFNKDLEVSVGLYKAGDIQALKKYLRSLPLRRMSRLWKYLQTSKTELSSEILDVLSTLGR